MSSLCRRIQRRLAHEGPTALQDDAEAREHLVTCEDCYAFLEALGDVDAGLEALAPIDPPDPLVARTLAAIEAARSGAAKDESDAPSPPRRAGFGWPLSGLQTFGSVAAATLVLITSWSLLAPLASRDLSVQTTAEPPATLEMPSSAIVEGTVGERERSEASRPKRSQPLGDHAGGALAEDGAGSHLRTPTEKKVGNMAALPAAPPPPMADSALSELAFRESQSLNQRANEAFGYLGERSVDDRLADLQERQRSMRRGAKSQSARLDPPAEPPSPGRAGRDANEPLALDNKQLAGGLLSRLEVDKLADGEAERVLSKDERAPGKGDGPTISPATRFANERRHVETLNYQSASGYWENTYVPGDPVMRWLEARLAKSDKGRLRAVSNGAPLQLESAARQTSQGFDPPTNSALSVFLHADKRGLEGEQRLLVQVGLRGAERHSRLRPAMNIGIVLDLRGDLAPEAASAMRALVHAFLSAKDVGDRFSLTVAGKPGGTWVASDAFRHGPITLALARLEGQAERVRGESVLRLDQAVTHAIEETTRGGDPNAPLGSSLVLLVSAQALGASLAPLEAIAHGSAVAGVPLSVVGVGDGIALDEIDRLALAGQGNQRLLRAPAEAEALVARELSSLSRVIARALRLRIRLAPGVKLVEVVGSERLDNAGAARVRQAEKSIDRRLARNFGIEADRGDDEEGIQVVIPNFHSGDSHSIVLDVVAPGPGPIADVTVRYKDMVFLRNGVARTNLTLGRDTSSPGPLERNAVKSYLAIRLSNTLKEAGRALLAGDDARAVTLVTEFRELLAGVRGELPGYQNDADLATDLAMLDEYLVVLGTGILAESEPRRTLADSLQLSGYFKTVPRSPNSEVQARAGQRR